MIERFKGEKAFCSIKLGAIFENYSNDDAFDNVALFATLGL